MKRFEFSLERLLKVKRQLERMAEMEQARAAREVAEARSKLDSLKNRLVEISRSLEGSVSRGVVPGLWLNVYAMSEKLSQEIEAAEAKVVVAEEALSVIAKRRATASTEVEVLSSLRGQRYEEWRQESAAKVQEQLDEVTMRRWMDARQAQDGAA